MIDGPRSPDLNGRPSLSTIVAQLFPAMSEASGCTKLQIPARMSDASTSCPLPVFSRSYSAAKTPPQQLHPRIVIADAARFSRRRRIFATL
eukprot:SAG22_NODE_3225_length_1846_cov_1.301088_1_plen_90_part_10